jgi:hypothetical protein
MMCALDNDENKYYLFINQIDSDVGAISCLIGVYSFETAILYMSSTLS